MRAFRAIVFLSAVSVGAAAYAQTAAARLEGVVQDQSGALVPNATVTVVNKKTQVRADVATDAQGRFVFPSLRPSEYTLTVEAAGFRKAIRESLVLNVSDSISETVRLELGSLAESVVVEATTVRVQTTDSQVSRAVTLRDIDVLPQLGRSPMDLAAYQPGIQITNPSNITYSRVNGLRQGSNNTTLDGIDVNDSLVPRLGLSLTAINTDSVGEFRMVTNGGKAEYGRNAGGQVEMITRSGTNNFHGNAFDYHRNTVLNANTFFNNSAQPSVTRPKFIQNMFGGSFSGPVLRDKTFFFGNYQGRRTAQDVSRNRTVLTPEAKQGVFRWKDASGAIQSYDIVANDPRGLGIDPTVKKILAMLPDSNNTDTGDGLVTAGYRFNNPAGSHEDQMTIKGDQYLGPHNLFLRWSWQRNSFIDSLNNADARFPGQPQGTQGGSRWGYSAGWNWTIGARVVNEVRFGYQSASVDFLRPGRLPEPMVLSNLFTDPLNPGFSQGRNSPVTMLTDNVSIVRGAHTFKGGLSWRFTKQWGYNDANIYPNVTLGRTLGNTPPASIGPQGLSSTDRTRFENLYNDLLGRINQVTVRYYSDLETFLPAGTTRERTNKFREYSYFFQDDWRIGRKLTLNLGIRYDFFGVPFEANGFQGKLDKAALVSHVSWMDDLKIGRTKSWYNNDWNNFAPRIGFAYDLRGDGRTALRGAWGIFYDRMIGATTNLVDGNTPGFAQDVPVQPNSSGTSDIRISDGIPPVPQPSAPVLQLPTTRSTSVVAFSPNLRTGYVQHFSLGVQQELFRNTVVELSYVGTRGTKMFMDLNLNQPHIYGDFLSAFKELQAFNSAKTPPSPGNTLVRMFGSASAAVTAVGASNLANGAVGSAADSIDRTRYSLYQNAGTTQFYLRNYPQFNLMVYGANDGRSYYNSLQFSIRRQMGALKVDANYTWSKSMDNISIEGNGFTSPMDSYNLALNRGLSDTDLPHSFNSRLIYTLPIGRGRRLAGDVPAWLDSVIGGWDVGALAMWQSGGVVTYSSGRATGPTTNSTWADFDGDRSIGTVMRRGDGVYWLTDEEKARFTSPQAGTIGTSGRNAFRGPRFFNIDLSLVKRFRLRENHSINFRTEAYNLLNNVNFGGLGNSLTTPESLGKLSGTVGTQRLLQMALRYEF